MVTHDPAVSRAADRVLRIQDGVIMRDAAPVGEGVEALVSCADMLRGRMDEFDAQRTRLEAEFKEVGWPGTFYVERRTVKCAWSVLVEELHRLG